MPNSLFAHPVVPVDETGEIINKPTGKNKNLNFSVEPHVGHWMANLFLCGMIQVVSKI